MVEYQVGRFKITKKNTMHTIFKCQKLENVQNNSEATVVAAAAVAAITSHPSYTKLICVLNDKKRKCLKHGWMNAMRILFNDRNKANKYATRGREGQKIYIMNIKIAVYFFVNSKKKNRRSVEYK